MNLFEVKKFKEEQLNENFKYLCTDNYKQVRKVIENWANGFVDRDNKFIDEFQTTFNSCFWELYCFAVIKNMNMDVDFNFKAPDFVVKKDEEIKFLLECIITNPAKNGIKENDVYEKLYHSMDTETCVDLSTIRLLNGLYFKHDKYKSSYSKIEELKNIPFIIGIAPFDQPNFQIPNLQAIRRVLYGHDRTIFKNNEYYNFFLEDIEKENGTKLPLGIFTNENMKDVTGILFSCVATIGKARALSNTEDTVFIQNRFKGDRTQSEISINMRIKYKNISQYHYKLDLFTKKIMELKEIKETNTDKYLKREPLIELGYKESLTDGLHLFLNPFNENKLSPNLINSFINIGINVYNYDIKNNIEIPIKLNEGFLFQRGVYTFKC